jgi:hypothetical protein
MRTEGRENGDLGLVTPQSGVPLNLQMSETRILIRMLRIYFPRISEFGSASEFRGGVEPPQPPLLGTPLAFDLGSSSIPTCSGMAVQCLSVE